MNPFTITSDAERTALLLTLFLALLTLLALIFVTFNNKRKRALKIVNAGFFLVFFVMLIILCTEHDYIADGFPLIFHSAIPVWRLWGAVIALFLYAAYGIASELIRRSKSIDRNSIKEALDTLPAAVCYFTENGLVKLCNLQMYRLFFTLSQNDLQSLDAEAIGVDIRVDGELPPGGDTLDVFLNAIRECLTNCVRHADGTELYVKVYCNTSDDILTVSNNGKPPQTEIIPHGGLSNLMKRVGYLGGSAQIQSFPQFMLTVAIPKNRGILH